MNYMIIILIERVTVSQLLRIFLADRGCAKIYVNKNSSFSLSNRASVVRNCTNLYGIQCL